MTEEKRDRPEVSERVIRARKRIGGGSGFLSSHASQARALVYFQGAVCIALLFFGPLSGPMTLAPVLIAASTIAAYLLLAYLTVRYPWDGAACGFLVLGATLCLAWLYRHAQTVVRGLANELGSDSDFALVGDAFVYGMFAFLLLALPVLILGTLYALLPKDDAEDDAV